MEHSNNKKGLNLNAGEFQLPQIAVSPLGNNLVSPDNDTSALLVANSLKMIRR